MWVNNIREKLAYAQNYIHWAISILITKNSIMKATELRIGNYVWEDYGGEYQILMISPNNVDLVKPFMSVSGRYDINNIKPIELTEEWLKKTDLKKGIEVHNDYFSGIIKVKYNKYVGLFELFIGNIPVVFVLQVHRLQNIFHELANFELTIK